MELWMWAVGYLGAGAPVGFFVSRHYFKINAKDPGKLKTYLTKKPHPGFAGKTEYNQVIHTRTELERLEACANAAVASGWIAAFIWPLVTLFAAISGIFAATQRMVGGKELAEARQKALTAETMQKVDEINASLEQDWKQRFGPDAPD